MPNYTELNNIDPDDISDILVKVEKSFGIKFNDIDLMHISTFGQFCDHVENKIQLDNKCDCTSQQAFYKLRDCISLILQIDDKSISTKSPLSDILPRQSRLSSIKKIETHLGFKLNILRPPHWLTAGLAILSLISIISLFINWPLGLSGLIFSIAGFWLANENGNELEFETVGQVAKKMARENYLKSRRNPETFNKKEIEKTLTDWFISDFGLEKSKLIRESEFV